MRRRCLHAMSGPCSIYSAWLSNRMASATHGCLFCSRVCSRGLAPGGGSWSSFLLSTTGRTHCLAWLLQRIYALLHMHSHALDLEVLWHVLRFKCAPPLAHKSDMVDVSRFPTLWTCEDPRESIFYPNQLFILVCYGCCMCWLLCAGGGYCDRGGMDCFK